MMDSAGRFLQQTAGRPPMQPGDPVATLDEMRTLLRELPGPDLEAGTAAAAREAQLTKPAGALGRLEELTAWLATWQGKHPPMLRHPRTAVFAANHGVAARGVSAYPAAVTAQMVQNFVAGGAAVNQLCQIIDADLRVYEMTLDQPTADFVEAPAMNEEECARAMAYGMMAVEPGIDVAGARRDGDRQHHRRPPPCAARCSAAAPRIGSGPAPASPAPALRNKTRGRRRGGRAPSPGARRSVRRAAPARRARARGDRRRGDGGAARPGAGRARRLCLHRGRRGALRRRPARARPLHRRASLGRAGPHAPARNDRQDRRCSISACGSAKARARRWRSPFSRPRSPAIPAWRPSPKLR